MILCAFPKDKKNLFGTVSCGTCMEVEPLYNIRLPFDSDWEYITKIFAHPSETIPSASVRMIGLLFF